MCQQDDCRETSSPGAAGAPAVSLAPGGIVSYDSAWAGVPGDRTGIMAHAVELTHDHATADLEGTPAVLRATDPLAWALGIIAPDQPAAAPAAPGVDVTVEGAAPVAAASTSLSWGVYAVLVLAGLVLLAAGAFAVARGD